MEIFKFKWQRYMLTFIDKKCVLFIIQILFGKRAWDTCHMPIQLPVLP